MIKRFICFFTFSAILLTMFSSCNNGSVSGDDNGVTPAGKTFYVSPAGDDTNDGSEASPFATIVGARDAVRKYKSEAGLPDGGIEVIFKTGNYPVTASVEFTAEDSGEEGKPIVYRAEKDAEVIFDGGVSLNGADFIPASDEVKSKLISEDAKAALLEIDLAAAGCYDLTDHFDYSTGWECYKYRQELYIDSERQTVARWPNEGYEITELVGGNSDDGNAPYIVIPKEKAELWSKADAVRYYGYPESDWSSTNYQENNVSIDADKSALVFINDDRDDAKVSKYFVYNVLSELDSPGEYYWDVNAKKLYYYPDGDISNKKISFSQFADDWFILKDPTYLAFTGITFENGRATTFVTDSAKLNDTHHITISDCVIRSFGGHFIKAGGAYFYILNNEIYNMGSGCIYLNGGGAAEMLPSNSVIKNNTIHDWSQTYTVYGAAVTLYGIAYEVSHNEMYNSPHEAIAFNCANSIIEYNYIHDVCSQTSDAGAIYSGRRWDWSGNIIRYNLIKDVKDTTFGGTPCAVYFDDMLSGQYCYSNILVNIAGTGFTVGGGRNNFIENNIMVNIGKEPVSYDQRGVRDDFGHRSITFPGGDMWYKINSEVVYTSDYQRFAVPSNLLMIENCEESMEYFIDDPGVPSYAIVRNNITYGSDYLVDKKIDSLDGIDIYKDGVTLDAVCHPSAPARLYGTFEANIKYDTDPGFVDIEGGNYSLNDDSRVYRDIPGFPKISYDLIGVISD